MPSSSKTSPAHLILGNRNPLAAITLATIAIAFAVWLALDALIDWQVQESIRRNAELRANTWASNFFKSNPSAVDLVQHGAGNPDDIARLENSFAMVNIVKFILYDTTGRKTFESGNSINKAYGNVNETALDVFKSRKPAIAVIHNDHVQDPAIPETYVEAYLPAVSPEGDAIGTIEVYVEASGLEEALEDTFQRVSFYLIAGTLLVLFIPAVAYVVRTRQLMRKDKQLLELTRYDQLTGILNRNSVTEVATDLFSRRIDQNRIGVLFIDVDYFKQVNDQYGHACGDKLLRHIADLLKASTRGKQDIVGRYGGDEFLVLCEDIAPGDFRRLYRRIMENAKTPCEQDGRTYVPSLSVGAYLSHSTDTRETALHRADLSVYAAKRGGRGQVVEYTKALEGLFQDDEAKKTA